MHSHQSDFKRSLFRAHFLQTFPETHNPQHQVNVSIRKCSHRSDLYTRARVLKLISSSPGWVDGSQSLLQCSPTLHLPQLSRVLFSSKKAATAFDTCTCDYHNLVWRSPQEPQGPCQKADSASVGLGWGPRVCISRKFPTDNGPKTTLCMVWLSRFTDETEVQKEGSTTNFRSLQIACSHLEVLI